jgi:hypothetical protein
MKFPEPTDDGNLIAILVFFTDTSPTISHSELPSGCVVII